MLIQNNQVSIYYLYNMEDENINLAELVVTPRMNYINYTGNEDITPSLNAYIQAQRDAARANAILNMQNRITPTIPIVPNFLGRLAQKINPSLSSEDAIFYFGRNTNPYTCVSTVTDAYGRTIPGNITFKNNAGKLGFVRINPNQRDHGDIVQLVDKNNKPFHAGIITGFGPRGMVIDHSDGGINSEAMFHDVDYWDDELNNVNKDYYRYIGTSKEQKQWVKDFYEKYRNS